MREMVDEKLVEAVKKAIEQAPERRFEESVDLAINLKDVDLNKPQNRIDEQIILPHGRGKEPKIAIFAKGELALKAKELGLIVINPDEIEELAKEKKRMKKLASEVSFFLSDTQYMPLIGRHLGIILGPRGKMPIPVPPNADLKAIVERLRKTVRVRSRNNPTFHVPVGTRSMPPEKIAENIEAVLNRIESKLERGAQNIRSVYVKTTMGPAVRVM
ncbi:MAG: large subunit ribosomal protein [Archaeoglobi archaeon]|nr:large subunit ribosomal protein [Archaeoglobi archaeon]